MSWIIKNKKELVKNYLQKIIPIWIITEFILTIGQVVKGTSLQGFWYWLGERRFNSNTSGIAKWTVNGNEYLRAYGTFSHPNSLAGFFGLTLLWWSTFNKKIKSWLLWWMGITIVILSGARTAILAFTFSGFKKWWLIIILLFSLSYFGKIGGWDKESFQKRNNLNIMTIKMIKDYPLFGIGLNNFIVKLPKYQNSFVWLQPTHNVFLLTLSEIGIVGMFFLFLLLKPIIKIKNKLLFFVFITAMIDHYWVTLPQNWWLLTLFFTIIS